MKQKNSPSKGTRGYRWTLVTRFSRWQSAGYWVELLYQYCL